MNQRADARASAEAYLRRIAAGIVEPDREAAAARLLERVAASDDGAELRAVLLELGAHAALNRVRGLGGVPRP